MRREAVGARGTHSGVGGERGKGDRRRIYHGKREAGRVCWGPEDDASQRAVEARAPATAATKLCCRTAAEGNFVAA